MQQPYRKERQYLMVQISKLTKGLSEMRQPGCREWQAAELVQAAAQLLCACAVRGASIGVAPARIPSQVAAGFCCSGCFRVARCEGMDRPRRVRGQPKSGPSRGKRQQLHCCRFYSACRGAIGRRVCFDRRNSCARRLNTKRSSTVNASIQGSTFIAVTDLRFQQWSGRERNIGSQGLFVRQIYHGAVMPF